MTTLTVNNRKMFSYLKIYVQTLNTLQYILTYLDSIENILILLCHSFYTP